MSAPIPFGSFKNVLDLVGQRLRVNTDSPKNPVIYGELLHVDRTDNGTPIALVLDARRSQYQETDKETIVPWTSISSIVRLNPLEVS